jgi:hypothetical protein
VIFYLRNYPGSACRQTHATGVSLGAGFSLQQVLSVFNWEKAKSGNEKAKMVLLFTRL